MSMLTITNGNGLCAIAANLVYQYFRSCLWKEKLLVFILFCKSDLHHFLPVHAELKLWEEFWKEKAELLSTFSDKLMFMDIRGFANN